MYRKIQKKLLEGQSLRLVFFNDTGFIGGAGIGHRRQIQSFIEAGHSVAAICWLKNPFPDPLPPLGRSRTGRWLGMHSLPHVHRDHGFSDSKIISTMVERIVSMSPDLVVVGNLHWAGWPIQILERLRGERIPTIAYLHDCYWLTGRCAYTGTCTKYLNGCDAACPTPTEYPPEAPDLIESAWTARREVFLGDNAIPLFANSRWMCDIASSAFQHRAIAKFSPLGLDTSLFLPIDRSLARRLLKLPVDGVLVLAGAIDLREPRKGGELLETVIKDIHSQTSARVLTFGARSEQFQDVLSLGVIEDERMMPLVYSAADLMIHTAHEESFGQTLMEASACGIPVISMAAGGMVDIARHGKNGMNVPPNDPRAYFEAVRSLLENSALRVRFGTEGRKLAEREHSLPAQYGHWKKNLLELCDETRD